MATEKRLIWLMTDFGSDYAVGRLKGSIKKKNPMFDTFNVIDLDHSVPAQKTLPGAWRLMASLPSLPKESVIVAIVDPHVGNGRKGVAIELKSGHVLVGPADKGLLSAAVQVFGFKKASFLENPDYFNGEELLVTPKEDIDGNFFSSSGFSISKEQLNYSTFHGLQIFAPVAAHIALGSSLEAFGPSAKEADIRQLVLPLKLHDKSISGCIVDIEAFGTVRTNIPFKLLERIGVKKGDAVNIKISCNENTFTTLESVRASGVFSEVAIGEFLILPGSCGGCIDLALRNGSAAERIRGSTQECRMENVFDLKDAEGKLVPANRIEIAASQNAVRLGDHETSYRI